MFLEFYGFGVTQDYSITRWMVRWVEIMANVDISLSQYCYNEVETLGKVLGFCQSSKTHCKALRDLKKGRSIIKDTLWEQKYNICEEVKPQIYFWLLQPLFNKRKMVFLKLKKHIKNIYQPTMTFYNERNWNSKIVNRCKTNNTKIYSWIFLV